MLNTTSLAHKDYTESQLLLSACASSEWKISRFCTHVLVNSGPLRGFEMFLMLDLLWVRVLPASWGWWSSGSLRFLVQITKKIADISKREKNSWYTPDKDNGSTFVMHVLKKWSFPLAGSKEQFKEICGLLFWRDWIFISLSRHGHGLKPSHSEPWEPRWCLQLGANMSQFSLGCSSFYHFCMTCAMPCKIPAANPAHFLTTHQQFLAPFTLPFPCLTRLHHLW